MSYFSRADFLGESSRNVNNNKSKNMGTLPMTRPRPITSDMDLEVSERWNSLRENRWNNTTPSLILTVWSDERKTRLSQQQSDWTDRQMRCQNHQSNLQSLRTRFRGKRHHSWHLCDRKCFIFHLLYFRRTHHAFHRHAPTPSPATRSSAIRKFVAWRWHFPRTSIALVPKIRWRRARLSRWLAPRHDAVTCWSRVQTVRL